MKPSPLMAPYNRGEDRGVCLCYAAFRADVMLISTILHSSTLLMMCRSIDDTLTRL